MKTSRLFILFIFTTLMISACNKPDQHPELIDPIYMDIQRSISETSRAVDEARKSYNTTLDELKQAKPQTGQLIRAKKKVSDADDTLVRAIQNEKYWKVKLENRMLVARESYLKAWYKKEHWPDPKEYEKYKQEIKNWNPQTPIWDVKKRLQEAGVTPMGNGHRPEITVKKEETKASGHEH